MKLFIGLVLWCLLLVLSWPLALLALVMFPVVWLLSLPFRLVIIVAEALLASSKAILLLPARLLGQKP